MLKFTDIIKIPENTTAKVYFHTAPGGNQKEYPADMVLLNDENMWQEMQQWVANNRAQKNNYLIAMAKSSQYGKNFYVFGGIYNISTEGDIYQATKTDMYDYLVGKLIIKCNKDVGRSLDRQYSEVEKCEPIVYQITSEIIGTPFPGYDNVRISFLQLISIIKNKREDWITALSNQKAVYLISDRSNGKLYVGSATSKNGMLLNRWTNYVKNGHGGNKDLKKLSIEYIKKNFEYSILENYNAKTDDNYILEREQWWMETLKTKLSGYNN